MRVYAMPYPGVMGLPMPVFWQLSGFVPRLLAEENRHLLDITQAAQNNEMALKVRENLDGLAPSPFKQSMTSVIAASAVRDEAGFNALKAMTG